MKSDNRWVSQLTFAEDWSLLRLFPEPEYCRSDDGVVTWRRESVAVARGSLPKEHSETPADCKREDRSYTRSIHLHPKTKEFVEVNDSKNYKDQ